MNETQTWAYRQVELVGGPCDGMKHIVMPYQKGITFNGNVDGTSGVHCWWVDSLTGLFVYDGFEPLDE